MKSLWRAAQGSLYRGAGRQRRSERLKVGPYAQGRGRVFFLQSVTYCLLLLSQTDVGRDTEIEIRKETVFTLICFRSEINFLDIMLLLYPFVI